MYAIIQTGGKQYKVSVGDLVRVEKLNQDLGSELTLTEVLLVGGEKTYIGKPIVENAKVTVVITKQAKSPKVIVFKKKRRQGYRRLNGHRQFFTELFVKSIEAPGGEMSQTDKEAPIIDVHKVREEKAQARIVAKKENKKKKSEVKSTVGQKKTAKKKATVTKKKTAKKKTAVTKKKTTKKKTAVTKKTAKKKTTTTTKKKTKK